MERRQWQEQKLADFLRIYMQKKDCGIKIEGIQVQAQAQAHFSLDGFDWFILVDNMISLDFNVLDNYFPSGKGHVLVTRLASLPVNPEGAPKEQGGVNSHEDTSPVTSIPIEKLSERDALDIVEISLEKFNVHSRDNGYVFLKADFTGIVSLYHYILIFSAGISKPTRTG